MGSGSSSTKKNETVLSTNIEPSEDIKAVYILKEEAKKLENAYGDRNQLDKYIEAVHGRQKANRERDTSAKNTRADDRLITDTVGRVVEVLIDYVDKINVTFDDLQGSLEIFHDAVVKVFEGAKSDAKKQNVKGSIKDILTALEKRIKVAKERTSVTKHQNVTPEILKSVEVNLEKYLKMKEDLDENHQLLLKQREDIKVQLKEKGVSKKTIEDIMQWKEDVVNLQRKYGHVLVDSGELNEEAKSKIKDLTEKNEALKSELDTLQNQCLDSDRSAQEANANVQKVEEKILEERLSHEVEINALKALIDKKDRIIKQLGGTGKESPIENETPQPDISERERQTSEHIYAGVVISNDEELKNRETFVQAERKSSLDSANCQIDSETPVDLNLSIFDKCKNNEKEEQTEEKSSDNTQNAKSDITDVILGYDSPVNQIDKGKNDKAKRDDVSSSKDKEAVFVAMSDDITVDETKSEASAITARSITSVSIAVQVSEDQLARADSLKFDEKEQTSSDLGMSVKSEFVENSPDTYEDEDGVIGMNSAMGNNERVNSPAKIEGSESKPSGNGNEQTNYGRVEVRPNDTNKSENENANGIDSQGKKKVNVPIENPVSEEQMIPESFADMIQLVSKDACITALETREEDVHIYEGTTKEIIYKRNDGGIDWDVAYHKGIGAVVRTTNESFGIDTIRVDIIDEVESNMLPDLVLGERPVSFHLHIQQKKGTNMDLKDNEVKLFVPHRPLKEYEDVTLIYSLNGEDWEDCDLTDEYPASVESDVDIVGTVLPDIRDVKLVVIAREKMVDLIAGEGDISYLSSFDESIRINISKDTFRSHTIAKLLVHHSHILELQTAVVMHEECRSISSCTAFISIVCASVTRDNILVDMDIPRSGVGDDDECRYTMFCLNESGWRLADCTWDLANRRLTINLMPGSRSYRVIGIEVPMAIHMEERLAAVKTLHEHTNHYQVCVFVRQRLDDPQQAVVMCLRSHLVEQAILELGDKGFSMGQLISEPFCIMDGDVLSLEVNGSLMAKPVNSEKMTMTFYPQREMSTRLLLLLPVDADNQHQSTGTISIIKHEMDDNIQVLNGIVSLVQKN